jgi:hypothetical protein
MANLLQSSQTQATTTPDYYTNYLSGIASAGAQQAGINPQTGTYDPTLGAQFVGPTDLQNQAFQDVSGAASSYQPTLQAAGTTLTNAGSLASPLSSANAYLAAAGANPSQEAAANMDPFASSVANQLSNIGMRNIQQNFDPSATSAGVGTGQYGSQRGAQVLGQVNANALNDLNTQIGQLMNSGYNTALTTAEQQNQLQGQLGSTAANAASAGQQNLTNVGQQQANLASTNQALGLGGINALSTLGGQQQTIAQNQQLFPLTNLSTLSSLLRGYNVPTTTTTTAQGSPLSALSTLGALSQTPAAAALSTGIQNLYKGLTNPTPSNETFVGTNSNGVNLYWDASANGGAGGYVDSSGNTVADTGQE